MVLSRQMLITVKACAFPGAEGSPRKGGSPASRGASRAGPGHQALHNQARGLQGTPKLARGSSWNAVSSYFLSREVLLSAGLSAFSIRLLPKRSTGQNIKPFPEAARNLPILKKGDVNLHPVVLTGLVPLRRHQGLIPRRDLLHPIGYSPGAWRGEGEGRVLSPAAEAAADT